MNKQILKIWPEIDWIKNVELKEKTAEEKDQSPSFSDDRGGRNCCCRPGYGHGFGEDNHPG